MTVQPVMSAGQAYLSVRVRVTLTLCATVPSRFSIGLVLVAGPLSTDTDTVIPVPPSQAKLEVVTAPFVQTASFGVKVGNWEPRQLAAGMSYVRVAVVPLTVQPVISAGQAYVF